MPLTLDRYLDQRQRWPAEGRHILAQYDEAEIVVYQAYRPEIAAYAVAHQAFGGPWSFGRMSWLKPNFLWMMYRCGWATKDGQEHVLAVRLAREAFDEVLAAAVEARHVPERDGTYEEWQARVRASEVRLQWDPDHDPWGERQGRRAIQLGLRGETLARYAQSWIRGIDDVTELVIAQREVLERSGLQELETPLERVYPVRDPAVRRAVRVSEA